MIVNQQSLRGIYVGFNTLFNRAFEGVTPLYTQIATTTPSTTDSETYAWLGDIPGMREWIGDREIQNLSASDYTIKNKDFELTVGVDRNAIEDDKIGLYNPSVEMLGESAAAHPDELIFSLLAGGFSEKCYDGQPFFSDAHKIGKKTVTNKSTAKLTKDSYVSGPRLHDGLDQLQGPGAEPRPEPARRSPCPGSSRPRHPGRRLHQRHQEHHAGHREASRRPPARRA